MIKSTAALRERNGGEIGYTPILAFALIAPKIGVFKFREKG